MSLHDLQSTSYLSYSILVSGFIINKIDKIQLRQGNIIHCILLTKTLICIIIYIYIFVAPIKRMIINCQRVTNVLTVLYIEMSAWSRIELTIVLASLLPL